MPIQILFARRFLKANVFTVVETTKTEIMGILRMLEYGRGLNVIVIPRIPI